MSFIEKRSERLYSICGTLNLRKKFPLMSEYIIPKDEITKLKKAVDIYLYESLIEFNDDILLIDNLHGDDMLHCYEEEIMNLPNITPNGLLLPKQHNFLSYNMLFKQVVNIVTGMNISSKIDGFYFPINVRIVNGEPNEKIDSRPRSSTKLHSDIWAAEISSHCSIHFPIYGDFKDNGVEFFEPGKSFYPNFVKPLDDFNDGACVRDDARQYNVILDPGHAYFLDSFLLHRTAKNSPLDRKLRLSLQFNFIPKLKIESDIHVPTSRISDYLTFDEWSNCGLNRILYNNQKARKYTEDELSVVLDKYADKYKLIELR